MLATISLDL
jgi:hypothetical protein